MKNIMELFKGDAAKFFGIDKKIMAPARTELIHIDMTKKTDDWVFLTEDNTYIHFEFQSTKKPNDLARFMVSDAILYTKERKTIKTIVVYSSNIKSAITELNAGSIKYGVDAFFMATLDGDKTYNEIKAKIRAGEQLTKQDLMSVVFLPLMKSNVHKTKRMEQAIQLSTEINDRNRQLQIQAMLQILADKFIKNRSQLSKIKEMLNMTRLMEMIIEDKTIEIAKNAIKEGADIDFIAKITGLDKTKIKKLKKELQTEAS